jgi:hypothetical protein
MINQMVQDSSLSFKDPIHVLEKHRFVVREFVPFGVQRVIPKVDSFKRLPSAEVWEGHPLCGTRQIKVILIVRPSFFYRKISTDPTGKGLCGPVYRPTQRRKKSIGGYHYITIRHYHSPPTYSYPELTD